MKNLKKKFVVLLFLASFSINVFSSFYFPIKWWDETVYANLGYYLQKNPFDYAFHGWGDRVLNYWPLAGFRAPLLPYIIAFVDAISNSNQFFVNLIIPFFGALGTVILYFLGKKLFDEKIGIYSSLLLAFSPTYVEISGKILTDILATTLISGSFLFFWLGFEKKNKKFKYLTGFVVALAILARYTSLIILPVFLIFLLTKKNLKFLLDKDLAITIFILLLTLSPLFVYGYFSYSTPLGPFIHGWLGASYWGGTQPWYFFIQNSFEMFSVEIVLFIIGFYLMVSNFKNETNKLFILVWFIFFLLAFSALSHKEDRFFLPLAPAFCIISAYSIEKFGKYKNVIFALILSITIVLTLGTLYYNNLNNDSKPLYCFHQAMNFLKNTDTNSVVFNDNSPLVYYYTHRESDFYTNANGVIDLNKYINENFQNRSAYVLWTLYGAPTDVRTIYGNNTNFKTVFSCPENGSLAQIYKHLNS